MNQQPSSSSSTADPLSFTTLTSAASGTSGASGAGAGADAEDFSGASVVQETKYSESRRESQDADGDGDGGDPPHELREQDRFLPIANVARIMKKSIPSAQGKIAKDARECVQECVSEFISFITSEASDRCQAEKRKTINGEDILFAMSTLGFDNYVEPLKLYLQKYRESIKGDKQQGDDFEGMTDEAFGQNLQGNLQTLTSDPSGSQVLLSYQQFGQLN